MHSHVEEAKEIYDDYHAKLNQTGTKHEPDFRVASPLNIGEVDSLYLQTNQY